MHFTLVITGDDSQDLSFGLNFIPNPCWLRGDQLLINLDPSNPRLAPGAVARLVAYLNLSTTLGPAPWRCALLVHPTGHGTDDDFALLHRELREAGFVVQPVNLGKKLSQGV